MVLGKIKNYYAIIATVLLSGFIFFVYQKRVQQPTTIPLSLIDSSVVVKILSSGKQISQNEVSYLTKDQFDKLLGENKELKEQVGSLKNLISKIDTRIEYSEKTVVLPVRIDSITKSLISEYEDSCIKASITTDTTPSHRLTYQIKPLELELITHYKKNGLFKPKTTVLDVSVKTGCGKSVSQKQVMMQPKKQKISLGLQGGYGLTLKGFQPYVGLGLGFRLF